MFSRQRKRPRSQRRPRLVLACGAGGSGRAGSAEASWRPAVVAGERAGAYDACAGAAASEPGAAAPHGTGPPVSGLAAGLTEALEQLQAAVETLATIDLEFEDEQRLLDGMVELHRLGERVAAQQVRVLGAVERREAYGLQGAVSAASWLRARTRVDPGLAVKQVQAARRLGRFDALRAAFEAGEISFAHVAAVTDAAVPRRVDALAACDETLAELACHGQPRDVRRAVRAIRDCADPDGSDSPPLDERGLDERRYLDWHRTIDGMLEVRALLDQLQGEKLLTVLDAFDQPDAAGTPEGDRRSAGQRRADALEAALTRILNSGDTPVVQGNKPHVVCIVDLDTLLGVDGDAAGNARLRHTGDVHPERARRLALDAKLQAVLTLGPWRVVNVGRTHRTLPPWLRFALEAVHRHCRGPDCDRPISWTEAHHLVAWATENGETDLNRSLPLCKAHHKLVTVGGWRVELDLDSGVCTWSGPEGQVIHVDPPAR